MKMRWGLWWVTLGLAGCAIFVARAQDPSAQVQENTVDQQSDPPSQVARIGVLFGNVSVEPASLDQFSAAEVNYPLTTGDRIYAGTGANADLQTGSLAIRLGQTTDLTVTAMTDTLAQFGLAQGSVHLRSFSLNQGATVELDTPNVAVTVLQPGDVRVDVEPNADATTVMVVSGQVQVDGKGLQQTLQAGQRVRLTGSDPVAANWLYAGAPDGLDRFSGDRDAVYDSAVASEQQDANPGTIGVEDLAGAGDWSVTDGDDAGPIWYPAAMAVSWAPYSCGHWTWIAPWGWTWVDCERWGFAPFHYGRWQRVGGRWGWRPGPPTLRPIYSPALVAFVGGPGLAVDGTGVTAWFPLGPREPYVPWYQASAGYLNRVNVSNIYDRNSTRARLEHNQRSSSPVLETGGDRVYANRQSGTTAVAQAAFAEGEPVTQAIVHLSPGELAGARILEHPLVTPQRGMVAQEPARALPRNMSRPELATPLDAGLRAPMDVQHALPGNTSAPRGSVAPQNQAPQNQDRTTPASAGVERPGGIGDQAAPGLRVPQQGQATHQPPTQVLADPQSSGRMPAATEPNTRTVPNTRTESNTRTEPVIPQVVPAVEEQRRQLYNRAVPPEPRPSFEEQQKAIQSTEPGRPLSPQQMQNVRQAQPVQNLRQNQPTQPAPQREVPRSATAPRQAPPARPATAPPVVHKP